MQIIGKKIVHFEEIDSTNEEARRLIKRGEGAEGSVLIADRQTRGRGKPGSAWFSPEGNLYLSAIVKPRRNPKDLAPITMLGALAGRSAIAKISKLPVVIKWPNDLLVNSRKVGGVLVERVLAGHLIIGIGINVNSLPEEVQDQATSLKIESKQSFPIEGLIEILISELDKEYLAYLSKV